MLDDDDGVGLRTDGPLISLKTHEDSQSGGMVQRGKVSQGLNPALRVSVYVLAWGPSTVPTTICPTYMRARLNT